MTVSFIEEIAEGRRAQNTKGQRTYQRKFRLKTSSNSDGPYAVGSDVNLPKIGSVYPDDASAWCTTLTVEQTDGRFGWIVTADYSSERELADDPTDDPALITWDSEQFQTPAIFDKTGAAIVNSAGDPFDPPNMRDDSRRVATIEKNLAVVPSWILSYQDAVNSDSFTLDGISIGAGVAKMQKVSVGAVQSRNNISFRAVHFTMHFEREGWNLKPLDAGFRELDDAASGSGSGSGSGAPALKNIRNAGDDELPAAPVPLDGAGHALDNPSYSNNVFLNFPVYQTLSFASLPLT